MLCTYLDELIGIQARASITFPVACKRNFINISFELKVDRVASINTCIYNGMLNIHYLHILMDYLRNFKNHVFTTSSKILLILYFLWLS